MFLIVLLSFLLLITSYNRISVFDRLQFFEKKLHLKCISALPEQSNSLPELKALVCGENFNQLQLSENYISTGLIHLFVVSGAHLFVLKMILEFLLAGLTSLVSEKIRHFLILSILTIYAAVCEFNPPVVRALILIFLNSSLLFSKNFWPVHFRILIAGLLSLLFCPVWITSLSLQLSWIISLGGIFNQKFLHHRHPLFQQGLQAIWIYPTLLLFQIPSPFFILTNFLFSSLLELFLFPFALLVACLPFLVTLFDQAIGFLKVVLGQTEMALLPTELSKNSIFVICNWVIIFLLQFGFHLAWVNKKRTNENEI